MKYLFKHENTCKDLYDFLSSNGYPAKSFFSLDFKLALGYLLEYLESRSIYCLVDNYNIIVFTTGKTVKTLDFIKKHKSVYIIKETNDKEERGIIGNYMRAIDCAFDFLNTPF